MPGGYVETNVTSDGRMTVRAGGMAQRPCVKVTRRWAVHWHVARARLSACLPPPPPHQPERRGGSQHQKRRSAV